jgi:hypothetical protein
MEMRWAGLHFSRAIPLSGDRLSPSLVVAGWGSPNRMRDGPLAVLSANSRNVQHVETTHSPLSRPKSFKPRYRDEGVRVLTPLTHFLALLPEIGITPKLKTPAEPLHEESRIVEDLVRSCQGYIGKT